MIGKHFRWMATWVLVTNLVVAMPSSAFAAGSGKSAKEGKDSKGGITTSTPIKHLVVIFQENVSFDHYFGTYPNAVNKSEEIPFHAKADTPSVNGLTEGLIENNANQDKNAVYYAPVRLDPTQNYTCSQNHDYTPEQQAFDSGLMDKFPEFTAAPCASNPYSDVSKLGAGVVMGYFDGNTVTALWNYAQYFSLNDNFFDTNFGPSTPGAINVVSGMTGGADSNATTSNAISSGDVIVTNGGESVVGDPDPFYDDCSGSEKVGMLSTNKNIGDLLTAKGISWGWFQGGFTPSSVVAGAAVCATKTARVDGTLETAYSAHHNPFEYYQSTSNPHHVPPASVTEIGHSGPANHQYDLSWFQTAALAGDLPAVSYLKANRAQDGHPGNSSPLDEQGFIVGVVNFLQSLPDWDQTAVIITYDDSDGWYDHVIGPIVNQSNTTAGSMQADALTGPGMCGNGTNSLMGQQARCGYGPRLPFLLISPYAKKNYVDNTLTDQSSVVRFIEDNWDLPQIDGSFDGIAGPILNMFDFKNKRDDGLLLDPATGQVVGH